MTIAEALAGGLAEIVATGPFRHAPTALRRASRGRRSRSSSGSGLTGRSSSWRPTRGPGVRFRPRSTRSSARRATATATPTAAAGRCAPRSRSGTVSGSSRSSSATAPTASSITWRWRCWRRGTRSPTAGRPSPSTRSTPPRWRRPVRASLDGSSYDLDALAAAVDPEADRLRHQSQQPDRRDVTRAALERFDGPQVHPARARRPSVRRRPVPDGASEQPRAAPLRRPAHVLEDLRAARHRVGYGPLLPPDVAAAPEGQERVDVTQSALDATCEPRRGRGGGTP